MADVSKIVPFILSAEGGYVNDSTDKGHETNKGVTWDVWVSYFGDTDASHHRFLAMDSEDWMKIFKGEYWDKILGDQINSQKIANAIVDWVYNSGRYYPELDIQKLINFIFKKHLDTDGDFGKNTIDAINECDENTLYSDILDRRRQYYNDIISMEKANIVKLHGEQVYEELTKEGKTQAKFLKGWLNRIDNLEVFNSKL